MPGRRQAVILQAGNEDVPRHSLVAPEAKEGAGMLRDTPADAGPKAHAHAGMMTRSARAVHARWRAIFLLAGAVLTLLGVLLASGAVFIPGILLLLFALLHGIGSSGCTSADQLAGWPGRG
jgi:hypothetical protein